MSYYCPGADHNGFCSGTQEVDASLPGSGRSVDLDCTVVAFCLQGCKEDRSGIRSHTAGHGGGVLGRFPKGAPLACMVVVLFTLYPLDTERR